MKFKISDIEINNFYSFKDAKYHDIKDYNVIIGKNNAGKSNLFRLFNLLSESYKNRNIEKRFFYNGDNKLNLEITLTFRISSKLKEKIFEDLI